MIDTVIIILLLLIIALVIAIGNAVDRYYNNILREIQILTRGKAVKDTDKQYVCEMLFGDGRVVKINKEGENR